MAASRPSDGLTIIVPEGFDQSRIPGILNKKRDWLRRVEQRLQEQRKFLLPDPLGRLPERITLRVIGEEWAVDYRVTAAKGVSAVERPGNRLLVVGDIDNEQAVRASLQRWLSRKAHQHLVPWLRRLAGENQFKVDKFTVKSQRTRWASCSARRRRRTPLPIRECQNCRGEAARRAIDQFGQRVAIDIGLTKAEGQFWKLALSPPGQSNRTDKSRLLAVLGISESEYVTRFTSPTQTDWVMRCTARKVLRTVALAAIYHRQGRLMEEIGAWERASALLPYPASELLALGYAELAAYRPQRALQEFDKAAAKLAARARGRGRPNASSPVWRADGRWH